MRRIRCPVLALTGDQDDTWRELSDRGADRPRRPGCGARHEVVAGTGHYVHIEDPDATMAAHRGLPRRGGSMSVGAAPRPRRGRGGRALASGGPGRLARARPPGPRRDAGAPSRRLRPDGTGDPRPVGAGRRSRGRPGGGRGAERPRRPDPRGRRAAAGPWPSSTACGVLGRRPTTPSTPCTRASVRSSPIAVDHDRPRPRASTRAPDTATASACRAGVRAAVLGRGRLPGAGHRDARLADPGGGARRAGRLVRRPDHARRARLRRAGRSRCRRGGLAPSLTPVPSSGHSWSCRAPACPTAPTHAPNLRLASAECPSRGSGRVDAMAIQKVLGIETEYGIIVRGGDSNPIAASSVLINAYVQELAARGRGHRGVTRSGGTSRTSTRATTPAASAPRARCRPEVETHLVNAVLTNGARYYVDHAHPELSTPECADPRSIVVYDRAAELILHRSMTAATALLPAGQEIVVYKNNSDRKGNSYGTHENYLMDRAVPFSKIVSPRDAALHHAADLHRRRQGRHRGARAHERGRALPADAAGRLLRGGGRPRDHAEATDRQHPRRAPRRRPEVPPPPRDRRRRQPLRGRHLPEGRHHGARAVDDRGRLAHPRPAAGPARCRRCATCPTT